MLKVIEGWIKLESQAAITNCLEAIQEPAQLDEERPGARKHLAWVWISNHTPGSQDSSLCSTYSCEPLGSSVQPCVLTAKWESNISLIGLMREQRRVPSHSVLTDSSFIQKIM